MFSRSAALKHLDFTIGSLVCRCAGRLNYWRRREVYLDPVRPADLKHILVIRPGGMGDMLLLLPLLDALRDACPQARVDLVCERRNRAVLELAGFGGRVLLYDGRPVALLAALRKTPYDLAIDSEQFHHFSAFFAWLSGAPVRIGFNINPLRNPLYTHLIPYSPDGHESDQFSALLGPFDGSIQVTPLAGRLRDPSAARDETAHPRTIAIHTGSGERYKCWSEEQFLELSKELAADGGVSLLFVGAGGELEIGRRIAAQLPEGQATVLSSAPRPTLSETAHELARADVFVGADSGLAHLAEAMGIPSVILFGPSSNSKWGPRAAHSRIVTHNVPCRPCCVFGYHKPCHDIACMQGISVGWVVRALQSNARLRGRAE